MGTPERSTTNDTERLDELIAEQESIFLPRRPRASQIHRRATRSLAGRGTSEGQGACPGPRGARPGSAHPARADLGPAARPASVPASVGIPREVTDLTLVVPFNDLETLERTFPEHDRRIAGMIVEPVMMDAGIIPPDPGYLEGVREITRRHGALLAFDEVQTGLTIAPGGATERFG